MQPVRFACFGTTWATRTYAVLLLSLMTAIASPAQSFTTLHSFDYTDGFAPWAALVQGTDGSLYGTTYFGANTFFPPCGSGCGTVFKITPSGTLTTLYSFCPSDNCNTGSSPMAALVQVANGDFYGTTAPAGDPSGGTVFKIAPDGTLTVLYTFCSQRSCTDGSGPSGALVQAANRNFYGTTSQGGATSINCSFGCGTVFRITPSGTLTTLYTFCQQSGCPDGSAPTGVVQAINGNFYGTTYEGGANCADSGGCGTVFKITPAGKLTTLYSFCAKTGCADGGFPAAALVRANDGNFYGTTQGGGVNSCGTEGCGTIFKITPAGKLTTLYSFCSQTGCPDGLYPVAALVQATDGNLYGTTAGDDVNGYGTVFKITPSGMLTTLYNFCSQSKCTDGQSPNAGLIQSTNGIFYGTTLYGGTLGYGTVFRLPVGLGPFVETQPTSGEVGTAVKILGTKLTDATSVTFNGTAAVFKVVSKSEIKTTVPSGATTGEVKVKTPKETLKSNVVFRVRK
jgi:uncharacterized repeat protein (TIGR03803 family)